MIPYTYDENAKMVDFRDTEDRIRDFFKEGSKSVAYPEFLQRLVDNNQVMEALFCLGKADYTMPYTSRHPEMIKYAVLLQSLIIDTAEELVKEGSI